MRRLFAVVCKSVVDDEGVVRLDVVVVADLAAPMLADRCNGFFSLDMKLPLAGDVGVVVVDDAVVTLDGNRDRAGEAGADVVPTMGTPSTVGSSLTKVP